MATIIKYRSDFHHTAYIVNIALIAMSLPLSKFAMSIFEFTLVFLWILSGFSFRIAFRFFKIGNPLEGIWYSLGYIGKTVRYNFIEKFRLFFRNKPAVILASIYLLHILGLLYTSNFHYATRDLRIKLPLLLFPVIFAGMSKLTSNELKKIFYGYLSAITLGIILSFYFLFVGKFTDVREISPFISPVRFSLNVAFGFFILLSFIFFDKSINTKYKISFALLSILYIIFLTLLESITGLSVILITGSILIIILAVNTKHIYFKISFLTLLIIIPGILFIYVQNIIREATSAPSINIEQLDKTTSRGNHYKHDLKRVIENGKYTGLYLCEKELREEWNKKSKIDFDSLTYSGELLSNTLIRYMTSKNLRKDADGVDSLSSWDIHLVEQGVANINYIENPGLRTRILIIIYGYEIYQRSGNPSGNSVMQRFEYTRAAISLISQHPFFGVGTGDMEDELYNEYTVMKSKLRNRFIFHAHNQFLGIAIAFGLIGMLWFIFALIYPPVKMRYFKDYYFLVFFIIIITSMFTDDTIETQSGATLFALFYSLLLLGRKSLKNIVS